MDLVLVRGDFANNGFQSILKILCATRVPHQPSETSMQPPLGCHRLPVVLAVDGKGLQQEPKNRQGLEQGPKGVAIRTERG